MENILAADVKTGQTKAATLWPIPLYGIAGVILIGVAWPASWLQLSPFDEYSFFPLWLGYILTVDAIIAGRTGSSPLTRNRASLIGMFLVSIPLWWAFEGINYFTENWHYIGAHEYSPLRYTLVASWHFSIVVPAVLETAELLASFTVIDKLRNGPAVILSRASIFVCIGLGLLCLVSLVFWSNYTFPGAWVCLFLILDPINLLSGRPSILGWLSKGDWRPVAYLAVGALVCGWFWEMWNFWAYPKWYYTISYVDFVYIFEMPLLGYGGYLPFGLEVYAVYHFLSGSSKDFWRSARQLKGPRKHPDLNQQTGFLGRLYGHKQIAESTSRGDGE